MSNPSSNTDLCSAYCADILEPMLRATKLQYSEIISIQMMEMPVHFTDTEFAGHRVQCKIAREDLILYLKWDRTVGSSHPVGYINDISGFGACLETALGDGFLDLDSVPNKLSFTSGVLANAYNVTNSANDLIMAYILFKVYGSTSFNTDTKQYNRSNALSILSNTDVTQAVGTSIASHNTEGGAIDTLFHDLRIANPTRFFNQNTGTQIAGIFETTADVFSTGHWNTVVGDVIEMKVVFVFKAPITRNMITGVNTQASTEYVIIPTDDTLQIHLQITATASRSARRIAQIASNESRIPQLRYVNSHSYLQLTGPNSDSIRSIDILISSGPFTVTRSGWILGPSENIPIVYDATLGGFVFNTDNDYTYDFSLADLVGVSATIRYTLTHTETVTIGSVETLPFGFISEGTVITGFLGPLPSILEIPSGFTEIQSTRFRDNRAIQEVILPPNFLSIGPRTFEYTYSLSNINFPDGLLSIGNSAFSECEDLQISSLPTSISSIGEQAFSDCLGLVLDTCPPNLTTIENRAFVGTSITFSTLAVGITRIGINAFGNCQYLTTIISPEGLLEIGDSAFANPYLSNIYVPPTISSIGINVFYGTALSTFTWNFGLSEIPNYTFRGCTEFITFTVPSYVTSIGTGAFEYCRPLSSIVFTSLTPPTMDFDTLLNAGTPTSVAVYPSGSSNTPIEWETALSNAGWAGTSIAV